MNYKNMSLELLEEVFEQEEFGEYWPKHHQLVSLAFALGQNTNYVYYWHDVGTGKTLTAIWTAMLWNAKKILVVCPISAFIGWVRDIQKTQYLHELIYGKTDERKDQLGIPSDIYITNYEGLKLVYGVKIPTANNKGHMWVADRDEMIDDFDCIIYDELHRMINHDSVQAKIALELSIKSTHRIGLSGTPIGKDHGDLWNQIRLLDRGETFGHSLPAFRQTYYRKVNWGWKLKSGMKEKILDRIAPFTLRYDKGECYDLEPVLHMPLYVTPTKEQRKWEKDFIKNELVPTEKGVVNLSFPFIRSSKLIQIMNGFIYVGSGDERETLFLKSNPKATVIENLLQDINGQVVVFYKFVEELTYLIKICKKNKWEYRILKGSKKQKDKAYHDFVGNPEIKIIFGHPKSASESYEFVNSSYMIFTTPIGDPKTYDQCVGRIDRGTQTKKCTIFSIISQHSIEEIVYNNYKNRNELVTEAKDYIKYYGDYNE